MEPRSEGGVLMGRLEVEIRHGHHHDGGGPAQWGAVVALIVLVLFAAAGHKEIGAIMHEVLTIAEIAAYVAAGVAVLAAVVVVIVARTRAARRARRTAVIPVRPDYRIRVEAASRAALDAPRRRAGGWPLPGDWEDIAPRDDDRRRYS
jgi:hypothetical protein